MLISRILAFYSLLTYFLFEARREFRLLCRCFVLLFVIHVSTSSIAAEGSCAHVFSAPPFFANTSYLGNEAERIAFLNYNVGKDLSRNKTLSLGTRPTDPSQDGIRYYSRRGALEIYKAMVKNDHMTPQESTVLASIRGEMLKLPAYRGQTWSGALMARDYFSKTYLHKNSVTMENFFSTSKKRTVSEGFMEMGKSNKPPTTHVRVSMRVLGRSGRDIENMSDVPAEAEVLYFPFTRFRIEKVTQEPANREGYQTYFVDLVEEFLPAPRIGNSDLKAAARDWGLNTRRLMTRSEYSELLATKRLDDFARESESVNWRETWDWILHQTERRKIDVELLREIHARIMTGSLMKGYERRRVRQAYQNGTIDEPTALEALRKINLGEPFTSKPQRPLGGVFREDLDLLIDRSEAPSPLPANFLQWASQNDFMRVDAETVRPLAPDKVGVDIYLADPKRIPELLDKVFRRFERANEEPLSNEDYVRVVTELEMNLLAIHPFMDGNGRSIRLLRDALLLRRGLPPPLSVTEDDFYKPLEMQWRERVREMQAYLVEARRLRFLSGKETGTPEQFH